jgi:sigma-B regulation protein RsbU (phosphoserine phosphatase)
LRGISIGVICLLLSTLLTISADYFQQIAVIPYINESHLALSSPNPLLRILSIHLFGIIWFVAAYMMFGLSALKRFFNAKTAPIFIVALVVTFIHREGIEPYSTGTVLEFIINFIIIWGFWRYDLLTGIMIMATYVVWYQGGSLFAANNAFYVASAWKLSGIYAVLVLLAARAYYAKNSATDFDQLAPKFFKNITERQRLKRELEIARQVQMSFLPNENPNFPQLEIASRCLPALEVGGDYYDFVPIGSGHLGVAIGDVSGKGTQAAFYMTLTKGFLRALANLSESPSFVLSQLNRLFYQNVKRGVFVSMIYSVFDFRTNEMILARAGHNPVLLHREMSRGLQTINPGGLGLGMEKGDIFDEVIEEVRVPFQTGDVFVFYTDGVTEAMNQHHQEFGEERLNEIISRCGHMSSEAILDKIFEAIHQFVGKTPQSDDMTMVVVKIVGTGKNTSLSALTQSLISPRIS